MLCAKLVALAGILSAFPWIVEATRCRPSAALSRCRFAISDAELAMSLTVFLVLDTSVSRLRNGSEISVGLFSLRSSGYCWERSKGSRLITFLPLRDSYLRSIPHSRIPVWMNAYLWWCNLSSMDNATDMAPYKGLTFKRIGDVW